ncbi:hypothetical protein [Sphingobacterium endophyticum]|uniref:hypothetical protein n=1 Tax=Sphingobacterium endophyticum TaxID=2546448 RepID=UPI0012E12BCF|nr:hypothetical protein [Sphingobacterium endophyticum]
MIAGPLPYPDFTLDLVAFSSEYLTIKSSGLGVSPATNSTYGTLSLSEIIKGIDNSKGGGKGERNRTKSAIGRNNPYKKLNSDPNKEGYILEKDSHGGTQISKPDTPGFWEWWNSKKYQL